MFLFFKFFSHLDFYIILNRVFHAIEQRTGSKLGKKCVKLYIVTLLISSRVSRKILLDESQARIKISRRNIKNLKYADDTNLMAESK